MDYTSKDYNRTQYAGSGNLDKRIGIYRYNTNPENWYDWVFRHIPFGSDDAVIEFACGKGDLWKRNRDRMPKDAAICLTDLNEKMLSDCLSNLSEIRGRFDFRGMDLQAIPAGIGPYSLVIANHVLYHLSDLGGALARIAGILKPGGSLVATTIGREDNKELGDLFSGYSDKLEFDHAKVAEAFGLENGREKLSGHFRKIELFEFENHLELRDPEPILDYAMSLNGADSLIVDEDDFLAYARSRLEAAGGVYKVTKRTGLFLASN